jgi:hypothetical protein
MSKHFWFHVRMAGWVVLLVWYGVYTLNAVVPIFQSSLIFLSHGFTGIAGTLLVLIGYYFLNETTKKEQNL